MAKLVYDETGRLLFTKEMKEEYTLLMPQMLPVHFSMMQKLLQNAGFKVDMLTTNHRGIVDEGLKYVHNDTCYPALLVIGQLIDAVKHGGYDPPQGGPAHHPDRRRLPGLQLHPPAAQGPGEGGYGLHPRGVRQPVRPGEEPRLQADPPLYPQGGVRHDVRGHHRQRGQPGPPL